MSDGKTLEDLERDIFGDSGSELSEDSGDERQPRQKPRRREASPRARQYDEEESGESADDYQDERSTEKKKKRVSRRRRDEEGEGQPKLRKRKRAPPPPENLDDLPPEIAAKRRLDKQIEDALKQNRGNRKQKKKKGGDEDVLDRAADEEVSRLREAMLTAAEDDEQANKDKLPAVAKLRLLPQVMDVLRKSSLEQSIIDNNLLEGVRRWLEPLPDRSLPALNIQQEFFRTLPEMKFIDASVLKESGVGRIVLFYTKCKRVTPEITRTAKALVLTWSRPIIKRSASYRDRIVPVAAEGDDMERPGAARLNQILAKAREEEKGRVRRNHVMIPHREGGAYTVAPRVNAGIRGSNVSVDNDIRRRKANAERLRTLTRKVTVK